MAPTRRSRGRPPKVGHTRMDAAWDAMRPFGFTQYMVVKTVKELLEVYGQQGWPFIEEFSYKVLLEAILDKVEAREKKKNDADASASNTLAVETPLGITGPAACSDDEPMVGEFQVTESPDSAAQTSNVVHPEQPGDTDIGSSVGITGHVACSDDKPMVSELQVIEVPDSATQTRIVVLPEQPGGFDKTQERRFYHGWISNDWEKDLVELKPGPLAEKAAKLLLGNVHEKRKRWDVKPEAM
ncbi:hypothetical protein SLE2022_071620 [Rubroshorea leprosula]